MLHAPPLAAAVALVGCWTAPVATVQPIGEPRLIQRSIPVESVQEVAVVSGIDRDAGIIALRTRGMAAISRYRIGPKVAGLSEIRPGDVVQATVTEELAVYLLRDGELPGQGPIAAAARVLAVDPSYRLLKLQYANGQTETFKVPRKTRLEEMAAGDSVVIQPVEVLALRRKS
jgi:translation initiation factor IF-1